MSERTRRILALAKKQPKEYVQEGSDSIFFEADMIKESDSIACEADLMVEKSDYRSCKANMIVPHDHPQLPLKEFDTDYDSDKDPEYQCVDLESNDSNEDVEHQVDRDNDSSASAHSSAQTDQHEGLPASKSRKLKRNVRAWKCNVRKQSREAGEKYKSKNGRVIQNRTMKPPCMPSCKKKCVEKFDEQARTNIFNNFWKEGNNIDLKRQFVAGCVLKAPVSRRTSLDNVARRNSTLSYYFENSTTRVQVCKTFFLNTISTSEAFVKTALEKKSNGGIVLPDRRGKKVPPNKLPDDLRAKVREHINSFPLIESHYSRERTQKKYLGAELNLSKMYALYVEHCNSINLNKKLIAKEWLYYDIFNHEFNLSFKQPANDTCDTCDEFMMTLKNEKIEERKIEIQTEYDIHLHDAKKRYEFKKNDKDLSRQSDNRKVTIMVDLQKCLPTPHLTNSQVFYLRKLWTLNLTIYNATNGKSHCAMWDETVGARGACEIASCILKWALDNVTSTCEELTIWSDNCAGQNRNFTIVSAYIWILRLIPTLKTINHKFLLKGHTHMEVDGVHSVIERAKKHIGNGSMMIPWDWQQFVRQCRFKELIEVYDMKLEDFKNLYEGKSAPLRNKKINTDKENFLISEVVHMQLRAGCETLYYKTSVSEVEFKSVDLAVKTRQTKNATKVIWPSQLAQVNLDPRPINKKKYDDVQKLLRWVPQCFHNFYKNLPHSSSITDYPGDE